MKTIFDSDFCVHSMKNIIHSSISNNKRNDGQMEHPIDTQVNIDVRKTKTLN